MRPRWENTCGWYNSAGHTPGVVRDDVEHDADVVVHVVNRRQTTKDL
jgi:hypothetical protein